MATPSMMMNATAAPATWTSPHEVDCEAEARVALIPFPQQVEWGKGTLDVSDIGSLKPVYDFPHSRICTKVQVA